jgi:DNA-binding MarR family transcriptional regulator
MRYPRIKLALFQKCVNLTMTRVFRAHGYEVTREQEVILRELCGKDGLNQVDLARRTGQDRNNMSRTLDILELKGLVVRHVSDSDKRSSIVFVTNKGRNLHKGVYKAVDEYRRILFRGISQEEIEFFATMIERLIANLEADLEPGQSAVPTVAARTELRGGEAVSNGQGREDQERPLRRRGDID